MRVLVTGGASGLGAALVSAYLARGAEVLSCDVAYDAGPASPDDGSGTGATTMHLDVRSAEDWEAALAWVRESWGGLDVLVNNAGVAGGGRVDVADLDEWQWITEINLFGVVRGTRTFVPMFKEQGSGTLVNVASLAGLVHPAGMGSYNAVKAAVVAFTETMGHELAAYGVDAHVVCPSYFRTNLMASLQGRDEALGQVMAGLVEHAPVGPEEIAAEVLAGIERGDEVILPDDAARAAYSFKTRDRAGYDRLMRDQAAKLSSRSGPSTGSGTGERGPSTGSGTGSAGSGAGDRGPSTGSGTGSAGSGAGSARSGDVG